MTSFNLDAVSEALAGASESTLEERGISFEGKNLKLNSAEDAQPLVDAINNCKELGFLNLAGNTVGVEAAAAIAKAIEKHPEFKRALWKDLFTGRLKEEIPKAVEHLGNGIIKSGAQLTELDLSDNAFGPIGVEGLAEFLRSPSCFTLRALRLNNNGLGIKGGTLLSSALTDCHSKSSALGTPLNLKILVVGRNRLENDGARAIATFISTIGTLEEIEMPQNGIYHQGITALSEAFTKNKNLQLINLNDNTLGPKGSRSLARALLHLPQLRCLNLGDCLLRNRGTEFIAEAIAQEHALLEEVNLESNEIRTTAGETLACALSNKPNLTKVILDGNLFGTTGLEEIQKIFVNSGLGDAFVDCNDNQTDDDETEEEETATTEEESSSSQDEQSDVEHNRTSESLNDVEVVVNTTKNNERVTVSQFLQSPTAENFLAIGENRTAEIVAEAKSNENENMLETFVPILMKVSALAACSQNEVKQAALETSEILYKEIFDWAKNTEQSSLLNNALLVHLGLIKSEDKKYKPIWNTDGCMLAIENALKQKFFPESTRDTLKVFLGRCKDNIRIDVKMKVITALSLK